MEYTDIEGISSPSIGDAFLGGGGTLEKVLEYSGVYVGVPLLREPTRRTWAIASAEGMTGS